LAECMRLDMLEATTSTRTAIEMRTKRACLKA
jgi:hypothetical protein